MGRQGAAVHELEKLRQSLLQFGGVPEHVVSDAGKADDLRRQMPLGVHKGLEPFGDLAVFQHHGADLGDGLPLHLEAGGLDVKAHELPVQRAVLSAVDRHPVVQIVDEVALHAVEELDLVPGGVPGVREGLGHAVVRDGDGRVAPADGGLDRLGGVRQGVHVAHPRVEVELHALLRRGVLPGLVLRQLDVVGVELDVLAVPGGLHLPLDPQPHAGLHGALQGLCLLLRQIFLDGDGVGVVRHVKAQPPHAGAPGLPALEGEHLPLHSGVAHLQVQRPHGHRVRADGLSHQDLAGGGLVPSLSAGCRSGGRPAADRGAGGHRGLHRQLHRHLPEAVDPHQQSLELLQLRLPQVGLGGEPQEQGHGGLIDAGAVHHRARKTEPQLSGELQLGEHLKKWNISGHAFPPLGT